MTETAPSPAPTSLSLAEALDDDWQLTLTLTVDPAVAGELWTLYGASFEVLRTRAAQRHLMTRTEFDDLMHDERIDKIIVRDRRRGGQLASLSIITNRFDAVPLVSEEYFRSRWPEQAAEGRLWYVGFVAVRPEYQRTRAMGAIIQHVVSRGGREGGVFAVDISEYNEAAHQLPDAIARLGRAFHPGIRRRRLDAQVYWAYEVPPRQ
jgi:GNAT superfamily N-acetyltransferase